MSKILLISPNYQTRYNAVNEDMRNEIRRQYETVVYGQRYENKGRGYHVPMIITHYGMPDLIIVWHPKHLPKLEGLRHLDIPKVLMVTDYPPEWQRFKNEFIFKHEFDLVCFTQKLHVKDAKFARDNYQIHKDTKFQYLPFAIDTERYAAQGSDRDIDVFAVMSNNTVSYPNRERCVDRLKSIDGVKAFVRLVRNKKGRVWRDEYTSTLMRSKMGVASNGRFMSVNFKHLEYCAAGCLMISDKARDFGAMGWVDGKTFVQYDGMKHLRRVVLQYKQDGGARNRIASAGRELVKANHDVRVRVPQLFKIIKERLGVTIDPKGTPEVADAPSD